MPFVVISDSKIHAPKAEYNVVSHCNYGCRECSHFSPHMRAQAADLGSFKRDLAALARVYHVGRFRLLGGEPLLHKNLLSFIRAIRESGITEKIQIVTNGSLLHRASDEIFNEIDMISVSWYPDSRCDQEKIDFARERSKQFDVELKVDRIDRFRMMQLDEPTEDGELLDQIYRTCQIAHTWYCQTFHEGYFYMCSRPLFTDAYLVQKGQPALDLATVDGIPLHEPRLLERLIDYLNRPLPLSSCRYCLGTVGRHIPWGQMAREERRSTAPLGRTALAATSRVRLLYLLTWAGVERRLLRLVPSPRLARILGSAKDALMREG
jgi:organic radical activating enzyme